MNLVLRILTFAVFALPCMCTNFIGPFLTPNIKNIVHYEIDNVEDMNYENYISASDQEKWMIHWNGSIIPEVTDAIIVLDEIGPNGFQKILGKEGAQRSLSSNIWLIHSKKSSVSDYFKNITFRFGLNVLLFFISTLNNSSFVTQIIGNGVSKVSYKVGTRLTLPRTTWTVFFFYFFTPMAVHVVCA